MYTRFENKNISELYIVRHGWVKPEYELTDNVYSYGKLAYKWLSARRRAYVETADNYYSFAFEGFWRRTIAITDRNDKVIGRLVTTAFSRKSTLKMENGFTAIFHRTSFWRSKYVWESEIYGPILRVDSPSFSSTDTIGIEQSTTPAEILPLLAFLGIHIIIIRRQREAAAASS
ncbi:hypothetical protein GCM10023149_08580 [Mucilaginibacter gynuensis]|uniref:Uncharacterized protein n=1 Tax=Mucilaginibacter gynuensis TaxID=1302236 RepID=A0ABP8FXN1_9SPHI